MPKPPEAGRTSIWGVAASQQRSHSDSRCVPLKHGVEHPIFDRPSD